MKGLTFSKVAFISHSYNFTKNAIFNGYFYLNFKI